MNNVITVDKLSDSTDFYMALSIGKLPKEFVNDDTLFKIFGEPSGIRDDEYVAKVYECNYYVDNKCVATYWIEESKKHRGEYEVFGNVRNQNYNSAFICTLTAKLMLNSIPYKG